MLSDRSYMRSDYPRETTSALTWILCATLAGALLQFGLGQLGNGSFAALFALNTRGIEEWRLWTLATYALLHDGPFHLLVNGLLLFLIGREVAPLLGNARFTQFYLTAAVLGGLAWFAVHASDAAPAQLVGASAAVTAMFIFFACVYPERQVTFLVFFVLPVTLKPKVFAWGLVFVEVLGLIFSELPNALFPTEVAFSAHLGGAFGGWLFFRLFYVAGGWDRAGPRFELPSWLRRRDTAATAERPPAPTIELPPERNLRAEVDRVLDKINSQGFGALTEDEKRVLDDAKDMLSRR
jgi:membrane associated rhomboid family serine protease